MNPSCPLSPSPALPQHLHGDEHEDNPPDTEYSLHYGVILPNGIYVAGGRISPSFLHLPPLPNYRHQQSLIYLVQQVVVLLSNDVHPNGL
jgi:hypothetical protein